MEYCLLVNLKMGNRVLVKIFKVDKMSSTELESAINDFTKDKFVYLPYVSVGDMVLITYRNHDIKPKLNRFNKMGNNKPNYNKIEK